MKTTKKSTKKIMTEEQFAELKAAEGALEDCREDLANQKSNVSEAVRDTREAEANLKKEKNHLAKAEKDLAFSKSHLVKLKAKYKGWSRPKPAPVPVHQGDDHAVPE